MTKEVAGIELSTLEEPLRDALETFEDISEGQIRFDLEKAPQLELTPDKYNSARSSTLVGRLGQAAGTLHVIAFAPFDGTGAENTYSRLQLYIPPNLPLHPKIVPRSKAGIHSEIHLPLLSRFTEIRDADPVLFAGHMDLLGLDEDFSISRIGRLGQEFTPFLNALELGQAADPTPRLTTGYDNSGSRFGDPHSVYNEFPNVVQVGAFLAITDGMAPEYSSMVHELQAVPQ